MRNSRNLHRCNRVSAAFSWEEIFAAASSYPLFAWRRGGQSSLLNGSREQFERAEISAIQFWMTGKDTPRAGFLRGFIVPCSSSPRQRKLTVKNAQKLIACNHNYNEDSVRRPKPRAFTRLFRPGATKHLDTAPSAHQIWTLRCKSEDGQNGTT